MPQGAGRVGIFLLICAGGVLAAAPAFGQQATPPSSSTSSATSSQTGGASAAAQPSSAASGAAAAAQPSNGTGLSEAQITAIPVDPESSFTVGVAAFRGVGVSVENSYLLQAVPLLIYQSISGITRHEYTPDGQLAYQKQVVANAIESAQLSLDTLYRNRSTLAFSSTATQAQIQSADAAIAAMQKRIEFLTRLDPGKIEVAMEKPVKFVAGGQGQSLLGAPAISPGDTARSKKLDFLVWGTITEVSDYLLVQVRGYESSYAKDVVSYDEVVSPNGALTVADKVTQSITEAILGRKFSNLVTEIAPSSALVYLDGTFVGIGNVRVDRIRPGAHSLEVRAPGYTSRTVQFVVSPLETKTLTVSLAAAERPRILIRSTPEGADAYISSTWVGTTPLLVNRPASDESLTLRLKNYGDYTTAVMPSSPQVMTVKLVPDSFRYDSYVASLRNRFYGSFGAFALSVIAPVTFYSLLQDYNNRLQNTPSVLTSAAAVAQYDRFLRLWHIWYYAYWGSFFVSTALFVNTAMDIGAYLQATN